MRTQPRAEQAPHAFNRVDVDLVDPVAIVITRPFPVTVIHGDVCVAPGGHPGVDRVFIGVDDTAGLNGVQDMRLYGPLLNVVTEVERELSTPLDHPQHWRFVGRGGAASSLTLQSPSASRTMFFFTRSFWPLCPAVRYTSSISTVPASVGMVDASTTPCRRLRVMSWASSSFRPSSWAIWRLLRFRPMRYKHATHCRRGWW